MKKGKTALIVLLVVVFSVAVFAETTDSLVPTKLTRAQKALVLREAQKIAAEHGDSFTVSMDAIPDYPIEKLCGYKPISAEKMAKFKKMNLKSSAKGDGMPAAWDWRDNEGVTKVKDQGECGSCWAFAATGNLEHAVKCYESKEVDLAEQDLINCNKWSYGCDGGCLDCSEYFVSDGAALESEEEYQAKDGLECKGVAGDYKLAEIFLFEGEDMETMRAAIYYLGSLVTVVQASGLKGKAFAAYSGGVYNVPADKSGRGADHAILLVGWDTAKGAWLLKNSWGEGWGDGGYGWVNYGSACIAEQNCATLYKKGEDSAGIIPH
ncbi:MAG: C1 family peptidase [Candidatus Wallbacteria bacterium]|nr:C1 family peptidase [Candidatus Wallbacteria bacterium]